MDSAAAIATTPIQIPPRERWPAASADNQRNRKTERGQDNDQANRPVWNVQKRKNLRSNLNQEPPDDGICDGDLVNVAPLQLGEEVN